MIVTALTDRREKRKSLAIETPKNRGPAPLIGRRGDETARLVEHEINFGFGANGCSIHLDAVEERDYELHAEDPLRPERKKRCMAPTDITRSLRCLLLKRYLPADW